MLTEEQERAAAHVNGPMMVVAGPGSGKTTVLTQRIQRLLRYTRPERIVVITFAKKAAREMQKRFAALAGENVAERVVFGTFHAVFYRWLREWGVLDAEVQIIDEEGAEKLYAELGWDMDNVPAFLLTNRDAAMRYEREKRRRHMVDFEDLITLTDRVIGSHAVWRQYDYFLIDEFQDINPAQYRVVLQMVGAGTVARPNLFVVGDEDQAIYAFRGSDPKIFLNFSNDFPGCQRVDLTWNFRCQARIVEAAGRLIHFNQERFEKQIRASKEPGPPPRLCMVGDEQEEARLIRQYMGKAKRRGIGWEEMAILCRTGSQVRRVAAMLEEAGIPYVSRQQPEAAEKSAQLLIEQDFSAMWTLAHEEDNRGAYARILQFWPTLRGAGNVHRVSLGESIGKALEKQPVSAEKRRELRELAKVLSRLKTMEKTQAYEYFWLQTGYGAYAIRRARQRGLSLYELLRQMRQVKRKLEGAEPFGALVSTMHGAKGLEFEWVWVMGLVEGNCPHGEAKVEEERRLLYVAMTRAKAELTLSYYEGSGSRPSRFLLESGIMGPRAKKEEK